MEYVPSPSETHPDLIQTALTALAQAKAWKKGTVFYKSGDRCVVVSATYDAGIIYEWPEGDGPYVLDLKPENTEQFEDWTDVEYVE